VKVLLEAGAEPNGADDDGETPLRGGRQGEGQRNSREDGARASLLLRPPRSL